MWKRDFVNKRRSLHHVGGSVDVRRVVHACGDALRQHARFGHVVNALNLDVFEIRPIRRLKSETMRQVLELKTHRIVAVGLEIDAANRYGHSCPPGFAPRTPANDVAVLVFYIPIHMYRDVDGASMPMVLHRDPLSGLPAASAEDRSQGKDHSRGIQVIARAAAILRVLEGRPDGLSLGQIAKAAGLARSTVQRIVAALAMENFVTTTGTSSGVRIGSGLVGMAAAGGSSTIALLRPHLRVLGEEVGGAGDLAGL